MDKKVISQEQFKKLVINEAKKYLVESSNEQMIQKSQREINLENIDSLINEISAMNKSISAIEIHGTIKESKKDSKREMDIDSYNKNKNIIHVNEGEKDKWRRMLDYQIPSDEQR